ncbi:hypothetical protein GCM10027275_53970 [Rhabdobacter roseus]|uniref:Altered inheritance of mitochondria protein 6 n=1 Tax=Rhabdobacter roseus TaxID=1655419 RepID=A0A840U1A9_9BACT|nr:phosphatidylinositol-specific phospholipase C/glycerophosphodiester phosphodiesterase family protein [Rhabdobacter roseus]MBB5287373.1 alkaline phosphatase [Rhabdobacter roseus]
MIRSLACLLIVLLPLHFLGAQSTPRYTTAQAHSHNDYEQARPFWAAYEQQFGSIEADVHLRNDTLFVAHDAKDMAPGRTLTSLYLQPMQQQVRKNKGRIYPGKKQSLLLLIDLKTAAEPTMAALVKTLEPYQAWLAPKGTVKVVVSGNTPRPEDFDKYPAYLYFDGRPNQTYTPQQLERVGLISQSFLAYARPSQEGTFRPEEKEKLREVIAKIHAQNRQVRFWATPDTPAAWQALMELGVDYLNTDQIEALAGYLR